MNHRLLPYGIQALTIWTTGSYHMDDRLLSYGNRLLPYGTQALTTWTIIIHNTGSYHMDDNHTDHRLLPYERDDQRLASDVGCSEQIQHSVMTTLLLLPDIAFNLVLALKEAMRSNVYYFRDDNIKEA